MRLFFAIGLTSFLGLLAGAALGAVGAGLTHEFLTDRAATLDDATVRFALARGASLGLLAGLVLGAFHWTVRSAAAAREGGKVRLGRIFAGTIGFGFTAAIGALAGGGLGLLFAGLSPEWTAHALDLPAGSDLSYAAAAIGTARGALLGAGVYALSPLGSIFHRHRPVAEAAAPS
ncbi:MAG: hypothetical protein ACREIU_00925 [Planctomycetota bacterium]